MSVVVRFVDGDRTRSVTLSLSPSTPLGTVRVLLGKELYVKPSLIELSLAENRLNIDQTLAHRRKLITARPSTPSKEKSIPSPPLAL